MNVWELLAAHYGLIGLLLPIVGAFVSVAAVTLLTGRIVDAMFAPRRIIAPTPKRRRHPNF